MTVRCEACGTENRDKAMFCRGCAGKLPSFVATRRPSATAAPTSSTGQPDASGTSRGRSSARAGRSLLASPRVRMSVIAGLVVAIGMSVAGLAWFATDTARHRDPPIQASSAPEDRLPAEASLSQGETLDDGSGSASSTPAQVAAEPSPGSDPPSALADEPSSPETTDTPSMANPPPAASVPNVDASATSRGNVKRPATTAHGGGRASDPRVGCEHLFFAFAARCEANHCQLPSYSRHPRCDVVREQRRKDDARRNSMPTS